MRSIDIRRTFFDYFGQRDHHLVPSGSLIPDDPTLLLTNAGMVPFKPYFSGERVPEHPRAMSLQKCARTVDIDNVGHTTRHATFFEMAGNFSFGDFFKPEAIAWAYELVTEGYQLDRERLWVTVFRDDDEAISLWRRLGVPAERIQRLDMADNYWSMGVPGPCGPCSEIFYDRGDSYGRDGGPAVNSERFLEIWNLVFMQYERGAGDGKDSFPILGELPAKNIDTGMGIDRMALILQDARYICETDLVAPTMHRLQEITGEEYSTLPPKQQVSYRVITDHVRSAAFLVADGVLPSNEGRGYVLRRLLRRAVRHARLLGVEQPILDDLTGSVIGNLGDVWPELVGQRSLIGKVVTREEDTFDRTLRQGTKLLDTAIKQSRIGGALPAETAFELHDTYGFPIDLTVEIAADAGLDLDRDRFAQLMDEQRRQAKAARADLTPGLVKLDVYREIAGRHGRTAFIGYDDLAGEATVLGLLRDGSPVEAAVQGQRVEVILDRSPFYAEAGGQVGDIGTLTTGEGAVLQVDKTRYGIDGLHVHTTHVLSGVVTTGQTVVATVDEQGRQATARSHSATHVLHATLRQRIGDHARQHGSLVEPGRLRFDFSHFEAIGPDQLAALEDEVNHRVLGNPEVRVWHATRSEAEAAGATALFGEKYGDVVRIVDIGDFSRELCGGTHVGYGSQAGPVRILTESSIGAGLRRVEALVGVDALRHANHERAVLRELGELLGARPDRIVEQLTQRLSALAAAEKQLTSYRQDQLNVMARALADRVRSDAGVRILAELVTEVTAPELRGIATVVLSALPSGEPAAVLLGCVQEGKANLVAVINTAFHDKTGVEAARLLQAASRTVGGGAGGTTLIANAGGRSADRLPEALREADVAARELLALR
ncbi:alanine--tRNA ligase [Catellatospora chokoriensis]|uniref:Alanine--tRNA ligase n=1 Tax=Catellatospora chokoriensis TaxID=310353 RepID=A0A8J3K7E1_9ACTN|nr:alanine--tRNA ligase [Catellatospora chokoriensis]GIF89844.1 alanine--tRNA ligase [Catellatospora chokoriensis]